MKVITLCLHYKMELWSSSLTGNSKRLFTRALNKELQAEVEDSCRYLTQVFITLKIFHINERVVIHDIYGPIHICIVLI